MWPTWPRAGPPSKLSYQGPPYHNNDEKAYLQCDLLKKIFEIYILLDFHDHPSWRWGNRCQEEPADLVKVLSLEWGGSRLTLSLPRPRPGLFPSLDSKWKWQYFSAVGGGVATPYPSPRTLVNVRTHFCFSQVGEEGISMGYLYLVSWGPDVKHRIAQDSPSRPRTTQPQISARPRLRNPTLHHKGTKSRVLWPDCQPTPTPLTALLGSPALPKETSQTLAKDFGMLRRKLIAKRRVAGMYKAAGKVIFILLFKLVWELVFFFT